MEDAPYPIEFIAERILRDKPHAWRHFNQLKDKEHARYSEMCRPLVSAREAAIKAAGDAYDAVVAGGADRDEAWKDFRRALDAASDNLARALYFPWVEYQVALGRCLVLAGADVVERKDVAT